MTAAWPLESKQREALMQAARYARQRADDLGGADGREWAQIAAGLDPALPDERVPHGDPAFGLVARIVADGDRRRAARANQAIRTLRRYERRILREASVMGYVLGYRDGVVDARHHGVTVLDGKSRFPHGNDIMVNVIEHCDSTGDLYPFVAALCEGRRRRITRRQLWPLEEAEARPRRPGGEESKESA